jgi:hypothetical protein
MLDVDVLDISSMTTVVPPLLTGAPFVMAELSSGYDWHTLREPAAEKLDSLQLLAQQLSCAAISGTILGRRIHRVFPHGIAVAPRSP